MVFESIVADLLNRFLGDYVENLDRSQLQIGIWGGDVVLKDLILKQNALDQFDLPVKTIAGKLGKLTLKIPWKNLYTAPVEACIERLFLLVVPNNATKYDPVKEEKYLQEAKQKELERIDKAKRANKGVPDKKDDTFVEKLATQIIRNLQIRIQDIHIRYEDRVTCPQQPFSAGFTLHLLSMQTTDSKWKPYIVPETEPKFFKFVELIGFAVYWNCITRSFMSVNDEEKMGLFQKGIASRNYQPDGYSYLLGPIDLFAQLTLVSKPEVNDYEEPKVLLSLNMQDLVLGISKNQYQDLVQVLDAFGRMSAATRYRKYRPNAVAYKGHYKLWWRFAYNCILEELQRRWNNWDWKHIKSHRSLCLRYAEAYSNMLTSPNPKAKEILNECEMQLDVFNITLIRQKTELEVGRKKSLEEERRASQGWFSSWWGGKGKDATASKDSSSSDIVSRFEDAMTPAERAKLYSAIGYSEGASTPENVPPSYVENKVDFTLNRLVLEVRDWTDEGHAPIHIPVLHTRMTDVQFHVQQRHTALRIVAGIKQLEVAGRPPPGSEGIRPILVASDVSKSASSDSSFELLHILFETEPLDGECDQRLKVQAAPLQIVYDALTVESVLSVFRPPECVAAESLKAAAVSGLHDFKEMSSIGLQYAIERHKKLDLGINIMSSRILIPQKGILTKDCALLVIVLGKYGIKTVAQKKRITVSEMWRTGADEKKIFEQMMKYSYDHFSFELSNMQVLMAHGKEDWESVLGKNSSLHLLHPTALEVQISLCLIEDDPRLPKLKVAARLPLIHIHFSDERLVSLANLLLSLPLPGDEQKTGNMDAPSLASSTQSVAYGELGPGTKAIARIQIPVASEPMNQNTLLHLSFEANEISISLGKEVDDLDSYLVNFCMNSMETNIQQRTFDLRASLNVGNVSLKMVGLANEPIDVFTALTANTENLRTEESHHHLKINYVQVDKKSPDFKTKWNSVERSVDVHYAGALLDVHAEAIMNLKEFGENLMKRINKNEPQNKTLNELSVLVPSRAASTINLNLSPVKKKRARRNPDLIHLKVEINVEELGVRCHVAAYDGALNSFNVKSLRASVIMKEAHIQCMASLGSIHTYDFSPNTIHKEVLRPLAEKTLAVELVIWEKGYSVSEDIQVRVLLNRIQFVFLNRFTCTLMGFINNFQSTKNAIVQASANAAEVAKQNMKEAYEQALRISLDIKVEAPIIIIPTNSSSRDALILDMGVLTIKNSHRTLPIEDECGPATLDEIQLDLQQIKLMRVKLAKEGLGLSEEWTVLEPISFGFRLQRNLSFSWYKDEPELEISGHLGSILVTLCEGDMAVIRRISSDNFCEKGVMDGNEGNQSLELVQIDQTEATALIRPVTLGGITAASAGGGLSNAEKLDDPSCSNAPVSLLSMRLAVVMDILKIDLLRGENKKEGTKNGLASLEFGVMSIRGCVFSDSSASLSIRLMHLLMEDSRRERGAIAKLLYAGDSFTRIAHEGPKGVLDVTVRKKNDDMFADVRIFGFEIIVCLQYLAELGAFFLGSEQKPEVHAADCGYPSNAAPHKTQEPSNGSIHMNLKVERFDIVLIADTTNIDTEALILQGESEFKYRAKVDHWTVSGSVKDLKLLSCQYNPIHGGKSAVEVLRPCQLTIAGSTPEGTGAHVEVAVSGIRITVFPGTIALLSEVSTSLTKSKEDPELEGHEKETDYGDIWLSKEFKEDDYWFLKTEVGEDAVLEASTNVKRSTDYYKAEMILVSVPSIQIAFEAGVGGRALPLLIIQMSHQGKICNWSSRLRIESSFSLQMDYYNGGLAVWEPIIETVEIKRSDDSTKREQWALFLEVESGGEEVAQVLSPNSEDLEEILLPQPKLNVAFSSKENLEVTVTKSCLEVLTVLGTAFKNAIKESTTQSTTPKAPYLLQNELGVPVNLKIKGTNFKVCMEGNLENCKDSIREICLQSGAEVHLGRMETNATKGNLINAEEEILSIEVLTETSVARGGTVASGSVASNWKLDIPVARVERRHFSLRRHKGEPWSLISQVSVENGRKVVMLRSAVQVINELREPVEVYYMTPRGNEVERIGGPLASKGVLNLPLRAVYSPTAELFFRVQKSTVSIVPFVWKELQKVPTFSSILRCDPKEKGSAPTYLQVIGETERIPHGKSGKHTLASVCHRVYLRPTVIFRNLLPIDVMVTQSGVFGDRNLKAGDDLTLSSACPGACSLVIKISDYLEREWSCKEEIMLNQPEISVWAFKSYDAMKEATLDLGAHGGKSGGTLELSLFSPCWMVNKTGFLLTYKAADDATNILYHPPTLSSPILFAAKGKAFFGKKKIAVRLEDGDWSSSFSLDAVGSSGVISCTTSKLVYQLGVNVQLTGCSLTKRVTFMPQVVLMNIAKYDLECREDGRTADPWVKVPADGCCAFWPHEENGKIIVRVFGTRLHTAPFPIDLVNPTLLRLSNKYGGVQVETQTTEGATYITFSPYVPGLAPALIINNLQRPVEFWEKDRQDIWTVKPGEESLFTWSDPSGARMLCWKNASDKEVSDSLREDSLGECGNGGFIVSFLNGMQRVLLLTEDALVAQEARMSGELEPPSMALSVSFQGLGLSLVDDSKALEVLHAGIVSSGVIWETRKSAGKLFRALSSKESALLEKGYQKYLHSHQTKDSQPMQIDAKTIVDFRLMVVQQPQKRYLRRSFLTGLWLEMQSSPHGRKIHAKINRLQVDCQIPDCTFPTIFAPVPPPKSIGTDSAPKPFVELSIVQHTNEHTPVQQFKYFKVLVQEFHVKLDIGFLNALLAVFSPDGGLGVYDSTRFMSDVDLLKEPLLAYVTLRSSEEQKNYYDYLHFSPLKMHLSFSFTQSGGSTGFQSSFLNTLLQSVGVTLTDVQDVVFRLAYFERNGVFLNHRQLVAEVTMHYIGQSLKQMYVLVLGLDVIGNPFGLVLGFTRGVEDLFYEPFQGAVEGPGEFAEGLVLGVRSLFGHTVGGCAGAASRIAGTLGKGIAALSFDPEFQRRRQARMGRKPANIQEGLARGGRGLVTGVVDGVSGVILKPISGAREEGFGGFLKGVGKGVVGLVARPTAGIVDFAGGSLDAVRHATDVSEEVSRLRPPRFLIQGSQVRPFAYQEAKGNRLLMGLERGRFSSTDTYVYHARIAQGIVLLTDQRVLFLRHNDVFGQWQPDWGHTWSEMGGPPHAVEGGIAIVTPRRKVLGLFGGGEQGRLLTITDDRLRAVILRKMIALHTNQTDQP